MKNATTGAIIVYLFIVICWIINAVKFFSCNFDAPWRDEITHAIGVFVPFLSVITVWF